MCNNGDFDFFSPDICHLELSSAHCEALKNVQKCWYPQFPKIRTTVLISVLRITISFFLLVRDKDACSLYWAQFPGSSFTFIHLICYWTSHWICREYPTCVLIRFLIVVLCAECRRFDWVWNFCHVLNSTRTSSAIYTVAKVVIWKNKSRENWYSMHPKNIAECLKNKSVHNGNKSLVESSCPVNF